MAALLDSTNWCSKGNMAATRHTVRKVFCIKLPGYFSNMSSAEIKHKRRNSSVTIRKEKDLWKEADTTSPTQIPPQDEVGIGLILAVQHFCMQNINTPGVLKLSARLPINFKINFMPPAIQIRLIIKKHSQCFGNLLQPWCFLFLRLIDWLIDVWTKPIQFK